MTDRKHAIELGQFFDQQAARITELEAENAGIKRDLDQSHGREQALILINKSQQEALAKRDTEIALLRGAESVHEKPVVPQITHRPEIGTPKGPEIGHVSVSPGHVSESTTGLAAKLAAIEPEPMPQFIRNAQIPKPKVADRRVPRHVA